MLAMLRKDCCVVGRHTAGLTAFWVLLAGMYAWIPEADQCKWYCVLPIMAANVVLTAVSSDQVCHWDRFAAMTPLRPWQLVLEKYLLAYGLTALLAALGALAGWISTMGRGGLDMWTAVVMVLLFTAMALPLTYRFGRHKGGTILLAFWGLSAAVILGTAHFRYEWIELAFGWMEGVPVPRLVLGGGCALLALNAGSVLLSVRCYTRRQRGAYDGDLG